MNVSYLYNAYTKIGEENNTNPTWDYLSCLFFTTSSSSRSFFPHSYIHDDCFYLTNHIAECKINHLN